MFVKRDLDIASLIKKKSHFLFGPRGTGKSRLIEETLGDQSQIIDLLSDSVFSPLVRNPSRLEEMILDPKKWIVIDEVQKIPALLDEVHRLIEKKSIRFLLTGSSARKLRSGGANLLGGRAWEARLFPLTWHELGQSFDLIKYLNSGGLPAVYFSEFAKDELRNYINLYLREEIQAEAIVRRFDHFVRFLDIAALANSEELNFEGISNDSGVPARTVASYFKVLEDTLIGFQLHPFLKTRKRKAIKSSKFYFFDVGVTGALAKRGRVELGSELFGRAFEHFIMQEVRAFLSYQSLDLEMCYWRSTSQFEVDLIVGTECAIEIKATQRVSDQHLSGLKALAEEKKIKRYFLVSNDPIPRKAGLIEVVPWQDFLKQLWSREIV